MSLAEQFPDDPDEDEDPTRQCTRPGCTRPRWSKHGRCQLCVEHAGKGVAYCLRVRVNPEVTPLKTGPVFEARRDRYRLLRLAGGAVHFSTRHCGSERMFRRALEQLLRAPARRGGPLRHYGPHG